MSVDLDKVRKVVTQVEDAMQRIEATERALKNAEESPSFAFVVKEGVAHLAILNEEQARTVNGTSITLDNLPSTLEEAKNLVLKALKTSIDKDKATLASIAALANRTVPASTAVTSSMPASTTAK